MLGSGRTELCELLFGIRHSDQGEIRILDKAIQLRTPLDAMDVGIALVPEDRRSQGIFAGLPIWKNISLASFQDAFRAALGFVHEKQSKLAALDEVDHFKIRTPSINQEIQLLSGGNQQKVILARWLLRRPQILLLDDPTAGVDVGAKDEIHSFIRQLAQDGLTVIMISSEFSELLDTCHRILVIRNGRIVSEMDPRTSTEAQLVRAASASVAT
jgi:ABC-type sugar transport system ATPase subunit